MFTIRNREDLSLAYLLLSSYSERDKEEKAIAIKREIRRYTNQPLPEKRIVQSDDDGCGYVALLPLPEYLKTVEEATEYFEECEVVECQPSPYDCTGQAFTVWYKVFKRNGRFYAYHRICYDF